MPELDLRVLDDLSGVDAADWNRLALGHPLLSHEFFHALHQSGCAAADSGWLPQFLTLWDKTAPAGASAPRLRAAMPLYLKSHSYGEYVFDWAWADAYQRHGLAYSPKLLAAIPFSPVSGPRLLAATDAERAALVRAALALEFRHDQQNVPRHRLPQALEEFQAEIGRGAVRAVGAVVAARD